MTAALHAAKEARQHIRSPLIHSRTADVTAYWNSSVPPKLPTMSSNNRNSLKVTYFFPPLPSFVGHNPS